MRAGVDDVIEPFFTGRGVPSAGTSSLKDSDFSTIRRVFSEGVLDVFDSFSGVKSGGKSHGDSESGFRSQDVTSSGSGGKTINTSNNESGSPDSIMKEMNIKIENLMRTCSSSK